MVRGSVALLLLMGLALPGQAETYTVNRFNGIDAANNDTGEYSDAVPGDGLAESSLGSGHTTLRAAIEEANQLPGHDIIRVPGGTTLMSRMELPPLTDPAGVTIMTFGEGNFTYDGSTAAARVEGYVALLSSKFADLDTNNDTFLSFSETQALTFDDFKDIIHHQFDLFLRDFNVIDTDNDNRISMDELDNYKAQESGLVIASGNNKIYNLTLINFPGNGIRIDSPDAANNIIQGCNIGTSGTSDNGNRLHGIYLGSGAHDNLIGGTTEAERNIISGNGSPATGKDDADITIALDFGNGIYITDPGTDNNRIIGNYIGVNAAGNAAVPNAFSGVVITGGASFNQLGGAAEGEGNIISGNGDSTNGCPDDCGNGRRSYYGNGVFINDGSCIGNTIAGNLIGLGVDDASLRNQSAGIRFDNTTGNTIGGTAEGAGNSIAGHGVNNFVSSGIALRNSNGARVEGNVVTSNNNGISIDDGAGCVIGSPGAGNVFSSNTSGVSFFRGSNHVFQGNFVGTDSTGTAARANGHSGLYASGSVDNLLLGGSGEGEGNVFSGNVNGGVVISDIVVPGNTTTPVIFVQGNTIGTDVTGTAALPNGVIGILLDNGARNVLIGGTGDGEGNVISGNGLDGIRLARSNDFAGGANHINVYGNLIGTNAAGTSFLPNVGSGLSIFEGGNSNIIGGLNPGEANTIAGNGTFGVRIKGGSLETTDMNTIRGNSIYSNGVGGNGPGIFLDDDANADIPAPVIQLIGPLRGTAQAGDTVDLYADAGNQGRFYLDTTTADGSGTFSFPTDLSGLPVSNLTALATDASGNTSEFSEPFPIAPPTIDTHPVSVTVVEGDPFTLQTEASGSDPLSYQWEFLAVGDTDFSSVVDDAVIGGALSNTLTNSAARLTDEGSYQCVVTNAIDSATTVVVSVTVIPLSTDTVVVTTINDTSDGNTQTPAHILADPGPDGFISLREAIAATNNRAGADTITFTVGGTITPDGGLPNLSDLSGGTLIDGGGTITVDGQNLGGSIGGFRITSPDNMLLGLTIVNFPGTGVAISGANATGNIVQGCLIGTDGTVPASNGSHGVSLENGASDNFIGGAGDGEGNVVSGNGGNGIYLTGANTTGNFVSGNLVGLSASGGAAIANAMNGIALVGGPGANEIGGSGAGEGNTISANNVSGVLVSGTGGATDGNIISGNTVGLGLTEATGLGNVNFGVAIVGGATNTVVGGVDLSASNTISGNGDAGVLVDGPASLGNTIRFNRITGNFASGIALSNSGNASIAAPVIDLDAGVILGTAVAGNTIDFYTDSGDEGADHLETVTADGNGDFATTVDLASVIGLNVRATATDGSGNTSQFSNGVIVDLEPPVLTLLGDDPATVQCGSTYVDAGVTAIDDVDGNITNRVQRTITFENAVVGAVNTAVLGSYTILYEVSDNAGQVATPVTRVVDVVDTTVPVITLNGSASVLVECSAGYTDAGATATDSCDGPVDVTVAGAVDPATPGVYPIVYRATDSQGNAAVEVTRTVTVADTTRPVITVTGDLSVTLECGAPYLDAGATVTDSCDTGITLETDNPVEPGVPGVYTVLYNAEDASGNIAFQVFRTVEVVDTTPPVIALLGGADVTVECGVPFDDPGASVLDVCEGDLPVIVTGNVNTAAPGNYTLTYSASDAAGNVAQTVTRIVRVADNGVPTILLNGPQTVNVACEDTYDELGATAMDNCEGDLTSEIVISGSVDTSTPGQYTVNYDVVDSVGNRAARVFRTVVVATCPAPCEDQCATDPANQIDEDGDGLSACVEACLGTSDTLIDTDGDGVPDNVEVETGTNPLVQDSHLDLDGDGLTQLEEFIFDSDPLDPNDPAASFFVGPNGQDTPERGTVNAPWRTIAYALAQSDPSAVNPVRIILSAGNYPEDVALQTGVTLVGAVGSLPRIEGTVFGAHNSSLINVEIAAFTSDDVMLVMDNVTMTLENVVFRGSVARPAAGILADGPNSGNSMIDGCLFVRVSIGIDVGGALPMIRRCTFEDTTIAGIFIRSTATIQAGASLGNVNDPSTGSNLFSGVTQGRAIINELATLLVAQQNDWGTTDLAAIERDLISGNVEVAPVLTPGSAADTASLYVTVWTASAQERLGGATVTVTSSTGASTVVRANQNGVYSVPVLRAGDYTIGVTAFGFEAQEVSMALESGELGSRVVALVRSIEKAGGPSCQAGTGGVAGVGTSDLLVVLLLLAALLVGWRRSALPAARH